MRPLERVRINDLFPKYVFCFKSGVVFKAAALALALAAAAQRTSFGRALSLLNGRAAYSVLFKLSNSS